MMEERQLYGALDLARLTCILAGIASLLMLVTSLVNLAAYFAKLDQGLDLLSHFRVYYLLIQILCLALLLILRSWRWSLAALILMLPSLITVGPYYLPRETAATEATFTLLDLNVLKTNPEVKLVRDLIRKEQPDLIALQEIDRKWVNELGPAVQDYPHRKVVPLDNNFGIGLYSKLPLSNVKVVTFGEKYHGYDFPFIQADARLGEQTFTMLVVHPLPPMGGFAVRNTQFADMARRRKEFGKHLIIAGDFNNSQWSPYFQDLLQGANLRDSQLGFGVQPTWPSYFPWMQVPIDHVLVSPGFTVLDRRTGPDVNSDHLPVIVELGLKK